MYILDIKLSRHFETLIVMLKFMFFSFFLIMEAFSTCNYVTLLLIVFTSSCHYTNSSYCHLILALTRNLKKKCTILFSKVGSQSKEKYTYKLCI